MNAIETIEYKGKQIEIFIDNNPIDPRGNDNLGVIAYKHPTYTLGEEKIDDPIEWLEGMLDVDEQGVYTNQRKNELEKKFFEKFIGFPVSLYDHSGISIHEGISHGWDTGQVGYLYTTKERILKEYGGKQLTKKLKELALERLRSELKEYDQYLRGNVYGFVTDNDSCWGYFGDEGIEDAIAEAKHSIDIELKEAWNAHYEKLKTFIKYHVPLCARQKIFAKNSIGSYC